MAVAHVKHEWFVVPLILPYGIKAVMTYCTNCGYAVLGDEPPREAGEIVENYVVMQGPPLCGKWMGFHGLNWACEPDWAREKEGV